MQPHTTNSEQELRPGCFSIHLFPTQDSEEENDDDDEERSSSDSSQESVVSAPNKSENEKSETVRQTQSLDDPSQQQGFYFILSFSLYVCHDTVTCKVLLN